ncbi:MAG TPA: TraB/GumN family protein [Novosphingobium sp.]|nr:TraB/GumN family protein [Novosphingobium sp.]
MRRFLIAGAALLAACQAEAPRPTHPALWEVTAPSGARGYVFGTIHALPDGLKWETPALAQAIAASDRLVLEIADGDAPQARETFLALATTPGQPPLDTRVSAPLRDELRKALAETRLDPVQFADLEDWAAALTLSLALEARAGFDPDNGADRALQARAGRRPVVGLETLAGQLALFDALPAPAQRALLDAVVAESADPDKGARLVAAWKRGDLGAIDREAHRGMLIDARLREVLLTGRNRAWAKRVAAMLRHGARPFVAVGAAHVAGVDGLPALLGAEGFEVRRVQ